MNDLFGSKAEPKTLPKWVQREVSKFYAGEQRVRLDCERCGFKGSASVEHYGKVRCNCGRVYWALRPKRDDSLVFFLWPGDWLMARAGVVAQ